MPVLNYLGRTYLALRELGIVTENEVDFVNGEIIINNKEQAKYVAKKEIILNGKKHNLEIKYYYSEADIKEEYFYKDYYMSVQATKEIILDNRIITTCLEMFSLNRNNDKIKTYIINDYFNEEKQYIVLQQYNFINQENLYYIIDKKAKFLLCTTDMAYIAYKNVGVMDGQYEHEQGEEDEEMYPKIRNNSLQLCYLIYGNEFVEDVYMGEIRENRDWCRVKYYIRACELQTVVIKIYDADTLIHPGAS